MLLACYQIHVIYIEYYYTIYNNSTTCLGELIVYSNPICKRDGVDGFGRMLFFHFPLRYIIRIRYIYFCNQIRLTFVTSIFHNQDHSVLNLREPVGDEFSKTRALHITRAPFASQYLLKDDEVGYSFLAVLPI